MRRADPEGTVVRALQIRVTHRRSYNVRAPMLLWHMDFNHKLIRYGQQKIDYLAEKINSPQIL